VIQRLLLDAPGPLRLSVSATTRRPRPGETDGKDYHFWTQERFDHEVAAGAFLEHAIVHGAASYGTLRSEVDPYLEQGTGVILDIDVQGAEQVRRVRPEHLSVFLSAPSPAEEERRLRGRGSEDESAIRRRLETARAELAQAEKYQFQIINDDLAAATDRLRQVVAQEFVRTHDAG
jgi:guanylate kinase